MAVQAKFVADLTSFDTAVQKSVVKLKDWRSGIQQVDRDLTRMGSQFSGQQILREATLAAKGVESIGGASKLTASEQQRVNGVVTEALAKYKALGLEAPAHLTQLADATKKLEPPLTAAQKAAGLLSSAFGQFTAANLASQAITGVVTKVGEFVAVGQKLPAVETSFNRLSAGVGQNSREMLAALGTATKGMVSDFDLMQSANKAMLLGLPVTTESMGELANAATTLGRAMGQDATKSFDDLITALGRSSPMILDNLGLTVKVEDANKKYAESLHKSADALTEGEKKLAFYQAAMEAARKKTAELGDQTKTLTEIVSTAWVKIGNVISGAAAEINVGIGGAFTSTKALATFLGEIIQFGPGAAIALARTRAEAEKLGQGAKAAAPQVEKVVDVLGDYFDHVVALQGKTVKLTDAQRALVLEAHRLGESATEIAKGLGVEERAVTATIKAHDNAAAAAKRHSEEIKKLSGELLKFATDEYRQVQALLNGGISAGVVRNSGGDIGAMAAPFLPSFGEGNPAAGVPTNLGIWGGQSIGGLTPPPKAMSSLGQSIAASIGPSIVAAFQGGGNVLNSVAGTVGGAVSKQIFGSETMSKSISSVFGKTVGGALNSILPGVGALVGPAITGISKLFGKLFGGGEGKETNKQRAEFLKTVEGGAAGLRKLAAEAGIAQSQVNLLFDTKKLKTFQNVATSVQKQLQQFADETAADQERLAAAVQKYGFTLEELGPKLRSQQLNEMAKELIEDWRVLAGAGIEVATVNEKMAQSINDFLNTALAVGAEVPAAMRPILQSLVDQGKLFDASGNKIESLEQAGVTFAETLTQGFDRVVQKLDELIQKLGMAGTAISNLPSVDVGVSGGVPGKVDTYDSMPQEGYATGTGGRYVDFGAGRAVTLHGKERVMTEAEGREGGAMLFELQALRRDFALLPTQIKAAVQMGAA